MKHAIEHGPAFAWLRVQLEAGESIFAEAGAMVMRSPQLDMQTRLNAGRSVGVWAQIYAFLVALMRKFLGGETLFINEFSGPSGGDVVLAPTVSGAIVHERMDGQRRLIVQSGSYLASTGDVQTKLRWGGLRGLLGGEGLFFIECAGQGDVFLSSYGGIHAIDVDGEYVVDSGHLVAFDGNLDFKVRSVGGLKSFFFSGEGLVCEFRGRGRLLLQSRNVGALIGWLTPFLRR
jgi:uncharacterized protein (TIGR00266 family)